MFFLRMRHTSSHNGHIIKGWPLGTAHFDKDREKNNTPQILSKKMLNSKVF